MRTASKLIGLTLLALAGSARAQDAAPAAATPAAPAGDVATAPAPAPTPAPAPAASAPQAGDTGATPAATTAAPSAVVAAATPMPAAAPATTSQRKIQLGLAFLPMGLGRYKYSTGPLQKVTTDAAFAYGVGFSAGYEIIPNLIVGVAPQAIFNVKEKDPVVAETSETATQYDLLARIAYVLPIADGTSVYAEVLPGYSIIKTPAAPVGFVVGFGAGVAMDMTDRFFVNIGAGYQIGFQKWKAGANTFDTSTRYLRVALGGGVRF
jgi:hypothetical protein